MVGDDKDMACHNNHSSKFCKIYKWKKISVVLQDIL